MPSSEEKILLEKLFFEARLYQHACPCFVIILAVAVATAQIDPTYFALVGIQIGFIRPTVDRWLVLIALPVEEFSNR